MAGGGEGWDCRSRVRAKEPRLEGPWGGWDLQSSSDANHLLWLFPKGTVAALEKGWSAADGTSCRWCPGALLPPSQPVLGGAGGLKGITSPCYGSIPLPRKISLNSPESTGWTGIRRNCSLAFLQPHQHDNCSLPALF